MSVKEILHSMTLKEKIYQTIIIHADERFYSEDESFLSAYAEEFPFGGVFVGEEIIGGTIATGDVIPQAIARYNRFAKYKPIICGDTEFGCGYMFPDGRYSTFPWQMALGAADDEELAYEYGKYTAIVARQIGINLSLSPVADINTEFHNPVVNTRAIGDRPELVRRMLLREVAGMEEYGLGATLKHFPGDGTDYRDQHYVLTNNILSVDAWRQSFGAVYQSLIDRDVSAVMVGHIGFPAYQQQRIDEIAPPASLSEELITGLLKTELGFKGVVMSDAVCMNGFRTLCGSQEEAEIESFRCGMDMMLWPSAGYADRLEAAIRDGRIGMDRLDDAVTRILTLKQKLGLTDASKTFKTDTLDGLHTLDRRLSEKAVTLVRDRHRVLPCGGIKNVTVVGITDFDDEYESLRIMADEFEKNGVAVSLHRSAVDEWEENIDLILYVTFCKEHKPCGPLTVLTDWQTGSHLREKCIAVALGSPYLLNSLFPTMNMAIAAYSDTEGCRRAVVDAILGKIPFAGTLPVTLPGIN